MPKKYEKIKKYFEKESGEHDAEKSKEIQAIVNNYGLITMEVLIEYFARYVAGVLFYGDVSLSNYKKSPFKDNIKMPTDKSTALKTLRYLYHSCTPYKERLNDIFSWDEEKMIRMMQAVNLLDKKKYNQDTFLKKLELLLKDNFEPIEINIDQEIFFESYTDAYEYLYLVNVFFIITSEDEFCRKIDEFKLLKLTTSVCKILIKAKNDIMKMDITFSELDRVMQSKGPQKKASKYKQAVLEEYVHISERNNLSDSRVGQILATKLEKQFPDNEKLHSKEKIPSVKTIIRWLKAEGFRQK